MKLFVKHYLPMLLALLLLVSVFSAATISVAAEEESADAEEDSSWWGDFWDGLTYVFTFEWLGDLFEWIVDIPFKVDAWLEEKELGNTEEFIKIDWVKQYQLYASDIVEKVYDVVYPFGVFVLIISWAFGVLSAGLTWNLDPANKYSILRAVFQLVIGLYFLSAAPELMTTMFAGANALYLQISDAVSVTHGHWFITLVSKPIMYLLLARIAWMQCVAPLFVSGAAGGETMRRIAMNFAKEYVIVCLNLPVFVIYFVIIDRLGLHFDGIIASLILAFSVFSITRRLEKIIH